MRVQTLQTAMIGTAALASWRWWLEWGRNGTSGGASGWDARCTMMRTTRVQRSSEACTEACTWRGSKVGVWSRSLAPSVRVRKDATLTSSRHRDVYLGTSLLVAVVDGPCPRATALAIIVAAGLKDSSFLDDAAPGPKPGCWSQPPLGIVAGGFALFHLVDPMRCHVRARAGGHLGTFG